MCIFFSSLVCSTLHLSPSRSFDALSFFHYNQLHLEPFLFSLLLFGLLFIFINNIKSLLYISFSVCVCAFFLNRKHYGYNNTNRSLSSFFLNDWFVDYLYGKKIEKMNSAQTHTTHMHIITNKEGATPLRQRLFDGLLCIFTQNFCSIYSYYSVLLYFPFLLSIWFDVI